MVTVVDAANLLRDHASQDFLRDRGETAGDGDDRTLVDLLVDQIEFADVIVVNKVSGIAPDQRTLVASAPSAPDGRLCRRMPHLAQLRLHT